MIYAMIDRIQILIGFSTEALQNNIDGFLDSHSYIVIKSCDIKVVKKAGEVFLLATIVYSI